MKIASNKFVNSEVYCIYDTVKCDISHLVMSNIMKFGEMRRADGEEFCNFICNETWSNWKS